MPRGDLAMMNADQCRKKADECSQLAQTAPDANGMQHWRKLSETWSALAEQIDHQTVLAKPHPTAKRTPAELAERTTLDHKVADLLRERLRLPKVTDAQRPKSSR
jgi:hypothetical protein